MTVRRADIEAALDELVLHEEGIRFQRLAVVLTKEKWPDMIASEVKKDLGLDAHTPGLLAGDRKGRGLACSLTATLPKIKQDVDKIRQQAPDVKTLIFATPRRVTNYTAMEWADDVRKEYRIELIIVSREDIITDLMLPLNASICRNHLGIHVAVEPAVSELLEKARGAASEIVAGWLAHPRLAGRPKIGLQAIKLDQEGEDTRDILDLASLHAALLEGRRIVLEAPAGRGKTTTLLQLAERHADRGELGFFVDLPAWMASGGIDLLEFIASLRAFRSRRLGADDLARLYGVVHYSFLLNGWNEVSGSYSKDAVPALAHLERDFPRAGIIVATRTHHIRPPLPGSFRARLRPLSRQQRTEYLQQALADRAEELGALLDDDRVLDDLTRTPLILAEVARIFQSGAPIPRTKVGVLAAVMRLVEQADQHRDHLERPPLMSRSGDYLAGLATASTMQGNVTIVEARARSVVHSVSLGLSAGGQIAAVPEPAEVLATLCAHHVLERLEHPSVGFRFQHQQFQEFYATVALKRELWSLVDKDDPDGNRRFAREYVNEPVWEEPLRMIAEEIGELSQGPSGGADAIPAGRRLIKLTVAVDPVFAAELSWLCGAAVWSQVRSAVSERLRAWYRVAGDHHRVCALAGMLASGSEEFIDIILPLLTSDDQQVRLRTYRAWGEFRVSTLGSDWRHVVQGWKKEYRADFVGEVVRERWMAEIAEDFARTDPSPKVRAAALQGLRWVRASDALGRVLTALDDEAFEEVLRNRVLDSVPFALQPRALATYERLLEKTNEPLERLRIRLATAEVGGERVSEGVKEELTGWPSGRLAHTDQWLLKSAVELVRQTDLQWVSHWVADRIVDGSLWHEGWVTLVTGIPEAMKETLLEKIGGEDLQHTRTTEIIAVLAATADPSLTETIFSKLCAVRRSISDRNDPANQTKWAIARQLEDLLRALPPSIPVEGLSHHFARELDAIEFDATIDVFSTVARHDPDLRGQLQGDLSQKLRTYLKNGVPFVLSQGDFSGSMKANVASALARVAEPEDMPVLVQLIRADIERVRTGRAARARGERGALANGAVMSYADWNVRAVAYLDSKGAEAVLLNLLREPEYESEAASALVRLARTRNIEEHPVLRVKDYRVVWEARAGQRASEFDEDRRQRYAIAIKQRIAMIMEERSQSGDPNSFNGRLKELAKTIAVLDGRESAEFVMGIMALPGKWDGSARAAALEALILRGAQLGADEGLRVLNPTIDDAKSRAFYDQQSAHLLGECLSLLPFLDPPSVGIGRIREIVATTRFPRYELRDVVTALGHSRCNDALDFLLELATAGGNGLQGITGEWIDAMAALDTQESKRVLLSFLDADIEQLGVEQHFEHHHRERLASWIVDIARTDTTVRDRLYLLCARQHSPSMRFLLADVVARLGTPDSLVAGLDLIQDQVNPPIPYEFSRGLESVFLMQRPYGDTGHVYTVEPRSANEIRSRLFEMVLNDGNRRHSALALLGQIEVWRLEYGRPSSEPRHPAFDSGMPWPPIAVTPTPP
ncbi:MAG: hypothetical protein L0Z46_01105 [Nitrospiraceae bacterium]|nr:hypothetical protein [Nitrospiraceae bacterium]